MSTESPTGSVGSQDPMEPPPSTETATAPEALPGTEVPAAGLPFEPEPAAEPAHEAEPDPEAEAPPEAGPAHDAVAAHEAEAAYEAEPTSVLDEAHETAVEEAGALHAAEEAFYDMAAELSRTLDEIEMERPAPIPAPILSRRGEMTPGRVVHFEPETATPDHEGSRLGVGGRARHFSMSPLTSTGAGVGMTPIATQRALSAAEIKIKLLEKALQQKKSSS
eukprot:2608724-Rhodomonas_salina.1